MKANNLETLPPCDALVKTSLLNDALTKALLNPDSMDSTFCNHFFELYNDVFVDVARQDGRVQLPRKALLIRHKTPPAVKGALGALVPVIGTGCGVLLRMLDCI